MPGMNLGEKIRSLFTEKRTLFPILVFSFFFLFGFIGMLRNGPLDLYGEGGDASFYVQIGNWYNKIFEDLPKFISGFTSGSFTPADYAEYGMVDNNPISTFFRSPVYGFYLGLFILFFKLSNLSILFSQAVLLGLLAMMIFVIVRRVANEKAAWIAVVLQVFHFSMLTIITQALTEMFLAVFLLFITWILLNTFREEGLEPKKHGSRFFLIGALVFLSMLIKPSMQYYAIVFIPGLIILLSFCKIPFVNKRKAFISFIAGLLVCLSLWVLFYHKTAGRYDVTTRGLEGTNLMYGLSPLFNGEGANALFVPKEFRDCVRDLKSIPDAWYQFYSNLALKAGVKYVFAHPIDMMILFVKKGAYWIMSPPYNIVSNQFFPVYRQNILPLYHIFLMILFLCGLVFMKRNYVLRVMSGTILVYLFLIHSAGVMDDRYFFPLLPFVIMMAAVLLANLTKLKEIKIPFKVLPTLLVILGNALILLLTTPGMLSYFFTTIESMKAVQGLIRMPLFLADGFFILRTLVPIYVKGERSVIGFFFLILITIYGFFSMTNPMWGYWKTSLKSESLIQKKIVMPIKFNATEYDEAYIVMNTAYKTPPHVTGRLNAVTFSTTFADTNISPVIYVQGAVWKKGESQWLFIPVSTKNILQTNIIDVRVDTPNCYLWGSYHARQRILPSFVYYSFFHYQKAARAKDKRVYQKTDLMSVDNRTALFEKGIEKKDLSLSCFNQSGESHVYLLLKRKGGYYMVKEFASAKDAHPKYLLLVNMLDRGIVKWLDSPDKKYLPVSKNILNVLLSEVDRFYSGYEVY